MGKQKGTSTEKSRNEANKEATLATAKPFAVQWQICKDKFPIATYALCSAWEKFFTRHDLLK